MSSTTTRRSPYLRVLISVLVGLVLASFGVAGAAFASGSS
jgi:hypothetical protein